VRPKLAHYFAELINKILFCSSGVDVLNDNRELVQAQRTWPRPIKRRDEDRNGPDLVAGQGTKETCPEIWK
jgi:hypothetical protein